MNPHTQLVNSLLLALGNRQDLGKFWKRATGAVKNENGAYIRYGLKGAADIEGLLRGGRHVEIECKTGSGRLHGNQPNFKRMIQEYGGIFIEARDIQGTLSELEAICSGKI